MIFLHKVSADPTEQVVVVCVVVVVPSGPSAVSVLVVDVHPVAPEAGQRGITPSLVIVVLLELGVNTGDSPARERPKVAGKHWGDGNAAHDGFPAFAAANAVLHC